jgi:hypothetical protein
MRAYLSPARTRCRELMRREKIAPIEGGSPRQVQAIRPGRQAACSTKAAVSVRMILFHAAGENADWIETSVSPSGGRATVAVLQGSGTVCKRNNLDYLPESRFTGSRITVGPRGCARAGDVLTCAIALATSDSAKFRKVNSGFGSRKWPLRPVVGSESRKHAPSYSRSRTSLVRRIS